MMLWCLGSGIGGVVQAHPQKLRFVENPGKILENLGKNPENLGKIPENLGKIRIKSVNI